MTMKLLIIAGSASLLLLGCSSPRGGTDESSLEQQNEPELQPEQQSLVSTNEGVKPAPMNTPNMPAGMNPRDLRDPQSMTIPGPPLGPRP
jgi:hypothetical protein